MVRSGAKVTNKAAKRKAGSAIRKFRVPTEDGGHISADRNNFEPPLPRQTKPFQHQLLRNAPSAKRGGSAGVSKKHAVALDLVFEHGNLIAQGDFQAAEGGVFGDGEIGVHVRS